MIYFFKEVVLLCVPLFYFFGECAYTLFDIIGLLSPYDDARMSSIIGFEGNPLL